MHAHCSHDHHHDHGDHDHKHGHDRHHGHDHSHGHGHGHGGHHHHVPKDFGWRFAIGAAVNILFAGGELLFGFLTQSLALMADAIHNFSDVIGLLLAWGAATLAKAAPTENHTYGYRGASFIAALTNAMLLFLVTGALVFEAVQRFHAPASVANTTVIVVASIGILINGATAMLFWQGQKEDINIRGAFLHMMYDAAISLGVVVGAVVIGYTGWMLIDPIISLIIAGIIVYGSWGLATEALRLSLAAVPRHIDKKGVQDYLASLPGVRDVHDLHIWAMSTTETALTVHLVRPEYAMDDTFLNTVSDELQNRFNIAHATIQIEAGNTSVVCRLAPKEVV